jgi:hypothetical protein
MLEEKKLKKKEEGEMAAAELRQRELEEQK